MSRRARALTAGVTLTWAVMAPVSGQDSQPDPRTLRAARPMAGQQADPYDAYAAPRTVTLQAGTGLLLRLPRAASVMMSAEPGIARVQPASPTNLFLMGVAPGRTTVIAMADTGTPIGQFDVIVTPIRRDPPPPAPVRAGVNATTARDVRQAVHRLIPGARSVTAEALGGQLVLRGSVPDARASQQVETIARGIAGENARIIDTMTVLGDVQVTVRVRVAEIDRAITRQLGFNWQVMGSDGAWKFGVLSGAPANTAASGSMFPGGAASTVPAAFIDPRPTLALNPFQAGAGSPARTGAGFSRGKWDINGIIDALVADQRVTILAEPNLTARSGETASFLAGGEFPVPIAGNAAQGGTSISVAFKAFGISLALVPTVLSPTRLSLRIRPEVSQLSGTGAISVPAGGGMLTIPALTVRRADTTVELGSGQSFAIAGLLQRDSSGAATAWPGTGAVPVIGALFQSSRFQRGESELVIIVTPYLVNPADDAEARGAQADGFRSATDRDRVLLGRQIAQRPGGTSLSAGFILK